MTDDEKKKTKKKMKEQADDARAKQIVNDRMRDVYEQAQEKLGNIPGVHVELVQVDSLGNPIKNKPVQQQEGTTPPVPTRQNGGR